jgi:hypothetical protein
MMGSTTTATAGKFLQLHLSSVSKAAQCGDALLVELLRMFRGRRFEDDCSLCLGIMSSQDKTSIDKELGLKGLTMDHRGSSLASDRRMTKGVQIPLKHLGMQLRVNHSLFHEERFSTEEEMRV